MNKPNPEQDGISHINIYSNGNTSLGRWLSNFTRSPFLHPRYGFFESMEGFWYWISTGKNRPALKKLYGFNAKKIGKSFPKVHCENFKEEIMEAFKYKLYDYPDRKMDFKLSTLPFMHYYVMKGFVIVPKNNKWLVDEIENIRKELKGETQDDIFT